MYVVLRGTEKCFRISHGTKHTVPRLSLDLTQSWRAGRKREL